MPPGRRRLMFALLPLAMVPERPDARVGKWQRATGARGLRLGEVQATLGAVQRLPNVQHPINKLHVRPGQPEQLALDANRGADRGRTPRIAGRSGLWRAAAGPQRRSAAVSPAGAHRGLARSWRRCGQVLLPVRRVAAPNGGWRAGTGRYAQTAGRCSNGPSTATPPMRMPVSVLALVAAAAGLAHSI